VSRASAAVLAAGLMLAAFNLRGAFVAVSPVLPEVRADTGMTAAVAGLLTTLPTLCFAIFSPLVPGLARRWGMDWALAGALAVLAAGVLLRLAPTTAALMAGTVVLGAGMAAGNVLLPGLIKRDFPGQVGLLTGLYVTFMGAGATVAAGTTVPLERLTGLDWRPVVALWAIPALLALAAWLPQLRAGARRAGVPLAAAGRAVGGLWRDPLAWRVVVFMGTQSLVYYGMTAWLPTLLVERGMSSDEAGVQLGVFNLIGLPASLVVPMVAARAGNQVGLVGLACGVTAAGMLGLLVAPLAAPLVWMTLLGVGQGATVGLALTLIVLRSPDAEHAAQLSGMVLSGGFLIAATGPLAMGALEGLAGSWTPAFLLPAAALLPMTIAGLEAGRARYVGEPPAGFLTAKSQTDYCRP
jgi:MFS transporter, CP family, cyanate transporter